MGRHADGQLHALLIDPSLFTPPYDQALTEGLEASGVNVTWATRPLRAGETNELDDVTQERLYYRGAATASVKQGSLIAKGRKALSHFASSQRLMGCVRRLRPDVAHFQWAVFPLLDARTIGQIRRSLPVVLTVHDLSPFNGSASSSLQTLGFGQVLRAASALVVHTESGRRALIAQGIAPGRIWRIPHGPLTLRSAEKETPPPEPRDERWRVVLFGKLQGYKGVETLFDALELLGVEQLAQLDVVIAGEPLMPMEPMRERAERLQIDLRPRRLTEMEAHSLLSSADAFVFPYREIQASGVLHLTQAYHRWTIASDLGTFREIVRPEINGALFPPGDASALSHALYASIGRRPLAKASLLSWTEIGHATRALYVDLLERRRQI